MDPSFPHINVSSIGSRHCQDTHQFLIPYRPKFDKRVSKVPGTNRYINKTLSMQKVLRILALFQKWFLENWCGCCYWLNQLVRNLRDFLSLFLSLSFRAIFGGGISGRKLREKAGIKTLRQRRMRPVWPDGFE